MLDNSARVVLEVTINRTGRKKRENGDTFLSFFSFHCFDHKGRNDFPFRPLGGVVCRFPFVTDALDCNTYYLVNIARTIKERNAIRG